MISTLIKKDKIKSSLKKRLQLPLENIKPYFSQTEAETE